MIYRKQATWFADDIPFDFIGVVEFNHLDNNGYVICKYIQFHGDGKYDYINICDVKRADIRMSARYGNSGDLMRVWTRRHPNYNPVYFETYKEYSKSNVVGTPMNPVMVGNYEENEKHQR